MKLFWATLFCLFYTPTWASEFSKEEIQTELNAYLSAPKLPLKTLYPKKDNRGNLIPQESVLASDFIAMKINSRLPTLNTESKFFSEPLKNDHPRALLEDDPYTESVFEMEEHKITKGEISNKPWSDDYWPHYKGGVAARYYESKFPGSVDWKENYDYIAKNPFHIVYESSDAESMDNLSPAEKYDLLIDKKSGHLTNTLWEEGEQYYRETGKVETWMGICHGWAAASYMVKRPRHAIQVLAFDGKTSIRFYPDDIKALISLLWANARVQTLYTGGRCNDKDPKIDEDGRPTNPSCRDNNPATWHNTIVNRVGLHKRSFVLDATYDYQVWNQPVVSYSYNYFNPQTMKQSSLKEAIVEIDSFHKDKFAKYRTRGTHAVVGIAMQVTYGVERGPTHDLTDSPQKDLTRTVLYTYDLELDKDGIILGGEWYKLPHPDFLWTPSKTSQAAASNDYYLLGQPNWDGKSALSDNWKQHAAEAATRAQPLAKILNSLLEISNKTN